MIILQMRLKLGVFHIITHGCGRSTYKGSDKLRGLDKGAHLTREGSYVSQIQRSLMQQRFKMLLTILIPLLLIGSASAQTTAATTKAATTGAATTGAATTAAATTAAATKAAATTAAASTAAATTAAATTAAASTAAATTGAETTMALTTNSTNATNTAAAAAAHPGITFMASLAVCHFTVVFYRFIFTL
uniref:spore coat protein SP65-like n=1 Tax=Epinephelus lanceolatus TaxID=310571 RepID=UPI001446D6E4|nr:spore coat protein SP65-like [Epinephelus lanceolatus]